MLKGIDRNTLVRVGTWGLVFKSAASGGKIVHGLVASMGVGAHLKLRLNGGRGKGWRYCPLRSTVRVMVTTACQTSALLAGECEIPAQTSGAGSRVPTPASSSRGMWSPPGPGSRRCPVPSSGSCFVPICPGGGAGAGSATNGSRAFRCRWSTHHAEYGRGLQ